MVAIKMKSVDISEHYMTAFLPVLTLDSVRLSKTTANVLAHYLPLKLLWNHSSTLYPLWKGENSAARKMYGAWFVIRSIQSFRFVFSWEQKKFTEHKTLYLLRSISPNNFTFSQTAPASAHPANPLELLTLYETFNTGNHSIEVTYSSHLVANLGEMAWAYRQASSLRLLPFAFCRRHSQMSMTFSTLYFPGLLTHLYSYS